MHDHYGPSRCGNSFFFNNTGGNDAKVCHAIPGSLRVPTYMLGVVCPSWRDFERMEGKRSELTCHALHAVQCSMPRAMRFRSFLGIGGVTKVWRALGALVFASTSIDCHARGVQPDFEDELVRVWELQVGFAFENSDGLACGMPSSRESSAFRRRPRGRMNTGTHSARTTPILRRRGLRFVALGVLFIG